VDPSEWISRFRITHDKAKAGGLNELERKAYLGMREELARSLVNAQSLAVPEGQNARRHFRVAQLFQVEVKNMYKTVTRELSTSGFSAMVGGELKPGESVPFKLTVDRSKDPVTGIAKVIGAVKAQGAFRTNFEIETMSEANSEILESSLFDAVLSRFK
jgi:hypothetical protein